MNRPSALAALLFTLALAPLASAHSPGSCETKGPLDDAAKACRFAAGGALAGAAKATVTRELRTPSPRSPRTARFWTDLKEIRSLRKGTDAARALAFLEPMPEGDPAAA